MSIDDGQFLLHFSQCKCSLNEHVSTSFLEIPCISDTIIVTNIIIGASRRNRVKYDIGMYTKGRYARNCNEMLRHKENVPKNPLRKKKESTEYFPF